MDVLSGLGGLVQHVPGLVARALYSIVLLVIAGACLYEVGHVWLDRSLQLRSFGFAKDGQDVPASGTTFARLLQQQQRALYGMYRGGRGGEQEIFSNPLDIRYINVGEIDAAALSDVKLEAQGVNIGSLLSSLRRWVSSPNEISGTVNQVGTAVYVVANWPTAPVPDSRETVDRSFTPLLPYSDIQTASFGLACWIFHAQLSARHAVFRTLTEEDFCAFSRAVQSFQIYLAARVVDPASAEGKKGLEAAKSTTGRLLEQKTTFPYAYKLSAYIQLEEKPLASLAKEDLDRVQGWLVEYLSRLEKFGGKDERSKARLDFLAARPAPAATPAAPPAGVATSAPRAGAGAAAPLAPGASLSAVDGMAASSICCIVERDGLRYILTTDYAVSGARLNDPVVSPALVDGGDAKKRVATVKFVFPRAPGAPGGGGVALALLENHVRYVNATPLGPIRGVGSPTKPGDVVRMVGRTSGTVEGKVLDPKVSAKAQQSLSFGDLLPVERISRPGDGGGTVVDSTNALVGLVYARSENVTLVLPVADVFAKLKLTLAADRP